MGWLESQFVTGVYDAGKISLVIYHFIFNLLYLFDEFVLLKRSET